jgi:hypothetical protein
VAASKRLRDELFQQPACEATEAASVRPTRSVDHQT